MRVKLKHLHGELPERHARAARDRSPTSITTIVLQQAGFLGTPERFVRTPIHFLVSATGELYQLHPFSRQLPTAYGYNAECISVMFQGNFPKVARSTLPDHHWRPERFGAHQLTLEQAAGGQALVGHLGQCIREMRHAPPKIAAMVQATARHANNPGPDVWAAVGAFAIERQGMELAPTLPRGRDIPEAWWEGKQAWAELLDVRDGKVVH